jgi:hypothetical protein
MSTNYNETIDNLNKAVSELRNAAYHEDQQAWLNALESVRSAAEAALNTIQGK